MSHFHSRCVWAALLLIFFLVAAPVARADGPTPSIAVGGGVADPVNKVVYLSDPAGSVVGLDIDKGTLLWESKAATYPVAVLGKQIYALAPVKDQPNAFRVVTLDGSAKGKTVKTSDPVTLPDWVDVGDANNRLIGPKTFYSQASLDGGVLKVRWQGFSQAAGKNSPGEAHFDLATGKVTTAPGKEVSFEERKHPEEVMRVIRKLHWNQGATIVAPGGRLFSATGGAKDGAWVLTAEVADLKTGELLWRRVYQKVRPATEK